MMNDCKDIEPDDGKLLVEEWVPSSRRIMLRACLNSGTTLDHDLFCIPAWAEYVDKDGTVWSRGGLFSAYLERIAFSVGNKIAKEFLEKHFSRAMSDFDNWLNSRIAKGTLLRVVENKKGESR